MRYSYNKVIIGTFIFIIACIIIIYICKNNCYTFHGVSSKVLFLTNTYMN